jgi:hypothetical protein
MKKNSTEFKLYEGRHDAVFLGIEEGESEFGPYLLWNFVVRHGRRDTFVNRATGAEATQGSDCARMLRGLLDRAVTEDDLRLIGLCVGQSYRILINYRKGWPQVQWVQAISNAI